MYKLIACGLVLGLPGPVMGVLFYLSGKGVSVSLHILRVFSQAIK